MSLPVRAAAGVGAAALAAAALAFGPTAGAHAQPGSASHAGTTTQTTQTTQTTRTTQTAPVMSAAEASYAARGLVSLNVTPRVQEKDNWCWAATGSAVAAYLGENVSQNTFCNFANGDPDNGRCANTQGDLDMIQTAFDTLGINPGRWTSSALSLSTIKNEVNAGRPMLARILWSSGGGHFLIVEGVDSGAGTVQWIDPWPSSRRVSVADYNQFRSNSDFSWTHSIAQIGA